MIIDADVIVAIVKEICEEISRARQKFPPFNSAHEGYAVLLEELDELWDAVKQHKGPERYSAMRQEAVQVAAMAICFLAEVEMGDEGCSTEVGKGT